MPFVCIYVEQIMQLIWFF